VKFGIFNNNKNFNILINFNFKIYLSLIINPH